MVQRVQERQKDRKTEKPKNRKTEKQEDSRWTVGHKDLCTYRHMNV